MTSFAQVPGAPDYVVSSEGRVYGPKGEVRPHSTVNGRYLGVTVRGAGRYLHRVVAEAFIPNPRALRYVDHWDNDGTNNRADNLSWVTHKENMFRKRRHGTHIEGSRDPKSKLTETDVRNIRKPRSAGEHVENVASRYGVSKWTIYDACNPNRQWKHVV